MKKVLLTLIVTMLTCIGAWADAVSVSKNSIALQVGGSETITFEHTEANPQAVSTPVFSAGSDVVSVEYSSEWNTGIGVLKITALKAGTATFYVRLNSPQDWGGALRCETEQITVIVSGETPGGEEPGGEEPGGEEPGGEEPGGEEPGGEEPGSGDTPANNFGTASSWSYADGTLTINLNASDDLKAENWGYGQSCPWASENGSISTVVLNPAADVEFNSNVLYIFFEGKPASTLDLRNLTAAQVDQLKSTQNLDKIYNNRSEISLKLPEGYDYDSAAEPWNHYNVTGGNNTNGSGGSGSGGDEGPGDDPKGRVISFTINVDGNVVPVAENVDVAIGTPFEFTMHVDGYTGNNMMVATSTVTKNDVVCDDNDFVVRYPVGTQLSYVLNRDITTILDPKTAGDYVVTFYLSDYDATWQPDGAAATKSITVHAYDPTIASSLSISPSAPTVDMGDKTTVDVTLLPATAALGISAVTGVEGVTATLADDKSSIEIDATNAASTGTATFTLTPNGLEPVTVTVTVVNPRVKATASCPASIRMGESLSASATLGEGLNPEYYTISYSSDATGVLNVDSETGALSPVSVGTANITVTVTPKEGTSITTDPYSQSFAVEVKKGELALALSASPAALQGGKVGSSTISHTVTLNGEPTTSGYTISAYELVGEVPTGVTIKDGVVSVPATVTTGEVKVQATITATDDAYECTTATAEAVIKIVNEGVVLSKETIDGKEYVVVNVINAGAFGTTISDNPAVINAGASLNDLKNAANVKVVGSLKNSDVQELVYLIGGVVADEGNCETLDMGEARMTEAITDINVGTESQPVYKCSLIGGTKPDGYTCEKTMLNASKIVFPQPAIGVEDGTVLPARRNSLFTAWYTNSTNNLKTLVIPEGWTKLADMPVERSTFLKLTSLSLPNTLVYIGDYAFESLHTPVLTIPPHVQHIGKEAFSSSQPGDVSDVYFTGKTAPTFVDQWAFSSAAQMANNTFVNEDVVGGKTDRNALQVGGKLLCIMHYPAGCEAEYIDQTRKYYSIRGENDNDPADARYKVDVWSEDEIEMFKTKTSAAHAENQQVQFVPVTGMVDSGYEDFSFADRIWPSQEIMTAAYSIAWIGYHWDGTPMTQAELDKRGLYQFVTFMSDSPEDQYDWDFKGYDNDKWYTIAVPFDMSVAQVKKVFGDKVQVCRFSKVTRKYVEGEEDNQIIFEFRNSVITDQAVMDVDADGNNVYSTGNKATYHASQPADEGSYAGFTGIVHNVPYMIKPKGQTDCPTRDEDGQLVRTFEGYKMKGEGMPFEKITADGITYGFVGTNRSTPLVKGTYFLGRKSKSAPHKYYFYTGGEKQRTPNTAAIIPSDGGVKDAAQFFDENFDTPESQAPAANNLISLFGDDEGITAIKNYTIVCGDDKMPDNKVYTINGVLVNGNNLPAGLYIKNGKKFIVK